jgi:hypothetical protein
MGLITKPICKDHFRENCPKCLPVQIIFTVSETPIDFNSAELKIQLEKVKEEIQKVMDGQKIDTSKLHIKFNLC